MQTAVHSKMVIHERYDFQCINVAVNWFFPIKARVGEVILIDMVSVYNNSGANYAACYKAIRHNGQTHWINYIASINNGVVKRWAGDNYLTHNDELGIGITPNAANETVQLAIQGLRFLDTDYDKLIGL